MSLGNVSIVSPGGNNLPPALTYRAQAAATQMFAGEPVKISGNYVIPSADAEPVTTSPTFVGIAATTSNATATLDGTVDVNLALPGMVFQAKAKDGTAVNTEAKILALLNTLVLFDLTAGVYTVDTAVAGATDGLIIVGGDIINGTVNFLVRESCKQSA